jgi:hypothetical protein
VGAYSFSKLLAGSYLLFLLHDSDPTLLEMAGADNLRTKLAAGVRVTLNTGVETRLDLRVADVAPGLRKVSSFTSPGAHALALRGIIAPYPR